MPDRYRPPASTGPFAELFREGPRVGAVMSEMAMVVTDLDGTLLDSRARLSRGNREVLGWLGEQGVVRVIATGRSRWSAHQVLAERAPIDYLIFSSGVGIEERAGGRLLCAHAMAPGLVAVAVDALVRRGLDLMVHRAVPDNHRFWYLRAPAAGENPDFERRLARYREFAQRWPGALPGGGGASQIVAIERPGGRSQFAVLRDELPLHHVVRTTSPLDHCSRWVEVFARGVSKSAAAEWLRVRLGIAVTATLAIGNDHNDTDLLEWAARACVVGNAVHALRERHRVVAANDEDGFAAAVRWWRGRD